MIMRYGKQRSLALSRSVGRTSTTISPGNSVTGSGDKPCGFCSLSERRTRETIHNGMLLLRTRYGLPYCELPDSVPSRLSSLLSFLLLQGRERAPCSFPRRQVRPDGEGLCSLQRLRRHERWELAHGMASIKRNLPKGCIRHTPSVRKLWEACATLPPPPSSDEYLLHVKRVCTQIFTSGWDRGYGYFVGSHLPNPSSRKPKLSRADRLWAGRREEFFTKTTSEADLASGFEARYKEVLSAGKVRPLLIFDENIELLAPLHKCVYSHLRKQDWLLCGPPTEERISSVCVNAYQTSVDLVAATDNLCHDVAQVILDCLFFTSVKIPRSLRALAKTSLSPCFEGLGGETLRVAHGQMMGSYLSFPLLCLQSYCAASWAARFDSDATFLVNGDDCIISASRGITVQDYPFGMRLNSDKTIVAQNVVEVNSTCFLMRGRRWREVRHLRRGGAPTDFPGMLHMASAVKVSQGFEDAFQRARIGRRWGFLPSQLTHYGYPSFLREKGMLRRRNFTPLPSDCTSQDEHGLSRIYGRDPTDLEIDALRGLLWSEGRRGGMKRDEFSPSCGKVRRGYSYRARPLYSFLNFVGWGKRKFCGLPRKPPRYFLIPDEFETEEEEKGRIVLDLIALALGSVSNTC